ncbi:MAG: hypothetical protein ACREXP_23150 [Steroidobacteraceae bacterium]
MIPVISILAWWWIRPSAQRAGWLAVRTSFRSSLFSRWANNSTMEQGGDLGYWVGYRIVKAYYQRAADKQ